jgi:hypothetical protein
MDLRENIYRCFAEVGGRLRVKSALNPVLWLCFIVTLPSLYSLSQLNDTSPQ